MRGLTLFTAMFTTVVLSAVLTPLAGATAPPTHAEPGHTVIPPYRGLSFHLRSTHGYEVAVRTAGSDRLVIEASSRGTYLEYTVPAHNSDNRIEAKIANLGAIAMRFDPSGPLERSTEPQGECKGRRERFQRGAFHGRFRFRGERGFTTVRASRASGSFSHSFREVCAGKNAGRNDNPELQPTLIARSNAGGRSLAVEVFLGEESASFHAIVVEKRSGLRVERTLIQGAGPNSYLPEPDGAATLIPPLPFTGTVKYQPPSIGGEAWSGSLSASFPGLGPIALAGHGFRVTDRRAE